MDNPNISRQSLLEIDIPEIVIDLGETHPEMLAFIIQQEVTRAPTFREHIALELEEAMTHYTQQARCLALLGFIGPNYILGQEVMGKLQSNLYFLKKSV